MKRRDFIKGTGALCGLTVLGVGLESCKKHHITPVNFTVDLSSPSNSALQNNGGSVTVNKVIIVRTSGGYIAVSNVCTHQSCAVNYSSSSNSYICPCHNGQFDINGGVLSGPPTKALTKYNTSVSGNTLTVSS